jgi:hypothetical protein
VPGLAKAFGTLCIVLLPLVAVAVLRHYVPTVTSALQFAMVFVLVVAAAQLGLVLRRWGRISLWRIFLDVLLSAVAGVVTYAVVGLAVRRGGGAVDPTLVAVIMAYILTIWSDQPR